MIINELLGWLRPIIGFLILMGTLVTIHEFGHFYVARKLGFKVLKFSIGFGKPLWSRKGKDDIEYIIGMIPLGGYVAMLDERAHDVAPELMSQTFNAQALWKRACVVVAGPLANILLAIVLLWGLFIYGLPTYKAYIGTPPQNTPFAQAGLVKKDRILSVDGHKVETYEQLIYRLIEYLDDGVAELEIERSGQIMTKTLDLGGPLKLNAEHQLDDQLGFRLYFPDIPARVGLVVAESSAQKAGITVDDLIVDIADNPIESWDDILIVVSNLKESESVPITVLRDNQKIALMITPKRDLSDNHIKIGIGVAPLSPDLIASFKEIQTLKKYGVISALTHSLTETYEGSLMIFKFVGRMIKGDIHINTMAGPISIANIAGQALQSGVVYFIQLAALFSINIGILNLFPIPVLDGGRLVGFMIEKMLGKNTIPERISILVMQFGAFLLIGFTIVVVFYDVTKWL